MPSVRKTSSKAWLNFVSRSWTRNRNGCSSQNHMIRLRACWATQPPSGVDVQANVLDPSRRERDEEEDVDPLQKGGFDGEEVAREHARRLHSQEGSPDGCVRCGAGWRPASSSTLRTEVAETVLPRPLSSPTIRLYPQCEFSRARRTISSRSERSSGGRPGVR